MSHNTRGDQNPGVPGSGTLWGPCHREDSNIISKFKMRGIDMNHIIRFFVRLEHAVKQRHANRASPT